MQYLWENSIAWLGYIQIETRQFKGSGGSGARQENTAKAGAKMSK